MAQLGKGPTYLPVGECVCGVSTGDKERERTACGVKNVPCRHPAAEDTMARPPSTTVEATPPVWETVDSSHRHLWLKVTPKPPPHVPLAPLLS